MLNCGIIGLPMVGKTTIYNLLTNAAAETSAFLGGKTTANLAAATVPDERIDRLTELYRPRKTIYAQVQFSDVPGLVRGPGPVKGGNPFLEGVRNADLLAHVVRAFPSADVIHVDGSVDPLRDIESMDLELVLSDLELLERKAERLSSNRKPSKEAQAELAFMQRCIAELEQQRPLSGLTVSPVEELVLRNYNLFTLKPMLLIINVDEAGLRSGEYPGREQVEAIAVAHGRRLVTVCGPLEGDIAQLSPADRLEFMAELGIAKPGIVRLAQSAYAALGLISFFTVGDDEVRAWTITRGTDARTAAGKIHTDIERGFIRAEVTRYEDVACLTSIAGGADKRTSRLEGKDYIVQDGDIINFRFNR